MASLGTLTGALLGTFSFSRLFWLAWFISLTIASSARAADVDWKTYGAVTGEEGDEVCFYEEKGITRTSDGHVRVWAKCLLQKDLDSLDLKSDLGKKIVDAAARRVIYGYVPPIAIGEDFDRDYIVSMIEIEQEANFANLAGLQLQNFIMNWIASHKRYAC